MHITSSGGSRWGAPRCAPPPPPSGQIFLDFMQFSGEKFNFIPAHPFRGLAPPLWKSCIRHWREITVSHNTSWDKPSTSWGRIPPIGGYRGVGTHTSSLIPNSIIFMQFFVKTVQILGGAPPISPLWGWRPHLGNPGSATAWPSPPQLGATHKVRSPTDPTEGVANSYSRLNWPIKHVPIRYLRHCNL